MSAYATTADVQARMTRTMSPDELMLCATLLEDAAVMIDAIAPNAAADARKIASCRMVIRAMGDGTDSGVPLGATQGSMTAGPYTQSWTVGAGGSTGELYIGKTERQLLGVQNSIGARSPLENMVPPPPFPEVPA